MRACPARDQASESIVDRRQEGRRHADRQRHPQRVAISSRVLDGDPAILAVDPQRDRPSRFLQGAQPLSGGGRLHDPGRDLFHGQVAQSPQQVVQRIHRSGRSFRNKRLKRQLQIRERGRIDEVAQLLLAEQLAQQLAVEG